MTKGVPGSEESNQSIIQNTLEIFLQTPRASQSYAIISLMKLQNDITKIVYYVRSDYGVTEIVESF